MPNKLRSHEVRCEVLVAGGGLSGVCCAISVAVGAEIDGGRFCRSGMYRTGGCSRLGIRILVAVVG